jgi:hypothetical protein
MGAGENALPGEVSEPHPCSRYDFSVSLSFSEPIPCLIRLFLRPIVPTKNVGTIGMGDNDTPI